MAPPWLQWSSNLPGVVLSITRSLLPPVLLVLLFMLVPMVMRVLARLQRIPQKTSVELKLMDRFFLLQVIVRASRALLDRITHKSTSARLSDRYIFACFCLCFRR